MKFKRTVPFVILCLMSLFSFAQIKTSHPFIFEGHSGEARAVSGLNSALVVYIAGGKNAKYSAEKYAKMLIIMFKDPKRTKNPTNISVVYEEKEHRNNTFAIVYSIGRSYDKNGGKYARGDDIYYINDIVADIDKITAHHAAKKRNK